MLQRLAIHISYSQKFKHYSVYYLFTWCFLPSFKASMDLRHIRNIRAQKSSVMRRFHGDASTESPRAAASECLPLETVWKLWLYALLVIYIVGRRCLRQYLRGKRYILLAYLKPNWDFKNEDGYFHNKRLLSDFSTNMPYCTLLRPNVMYVLWYLVTWICYRRTSALHNTRHLTADLLYK